MDAKDINRIMVMGAGAVGGYFGGQLARRTSSEVGFVTRGSHLEMLKTNGLAIKSFEGDAHIPVKAIRDPAEMGGAPEIILFTVKSYDTAEAIRAITPSVSEYTQIVTLQNGIENYPKLVGAFGEDRVIQGFCKIGAGVPEPGVVEHSAFGNITIGEYDGRLSDRVQDLAALFQKAGIPVTISDNIEHDVWLKFTWNCLLNMVTAAGNVTVDQIFEQPESVQLCYKLFEELQDVAQKEGVKLTDKEGADIIESARKLKGFETSTYQDRRKGKPMEYDAFTGAVLRLAEKHGLELPAHKTLYAILKLVDNDSA